MNNYILERKVPACLKETSLSHLIKKSTLNIETMKIYNLSFTLKVIQRVIAVHIIEYISTHDMDYTMVSAYQWFHNTEAALLRLQNDVFSEMDRKMSHSLCCLI